MHFSGLIESLSRTGYMLRSACFPLIYHDDNWKERLNEEMKHHEKNLEDISNKI